MCFNCFFFCVCVVHHPFLPTPALQPHLLRWHKEQSTPKTSGCIAQLSNYPRQETLQRGAGQPEALTVDTGECSRFHLESGCLNRRVQHSSEVLEAGEWMFTQGNSTLTVLLEHKTNVCPGKCRSQARILYWVCGFGAYTEGVTARVSVAGCMSCSPQMKAKQQLWELLLGTCWAGEAG